MMFLPQMLGARDLPIPAALRVRVLGLLIGGIFSGSIFFGAAPSGGWFMYPPLTSSYTAGIGPDIWLLGFRSSRWRRSRRPVEMIVGTLKCRPPGCD